MMFDVLYELSKLGVERLAVWTHFPQSRNHVLDLLMFLERFLHQCSIMSPEVRPLTIDGVAHEEPHMSHGGKGKQHASDRGTIWGVTPADNARYLPARTGNERYPCHLD
jgi:hypothetical protein